MEKMFSKYHASAGARLCQLKEEFQQAYIQLFEETWETVHRLETTKIRNLAKFFALLLYSDSLPWVVLANVKLTEDNTNSASRIFLKCLMLELSEELGVRKLYDRLHDPEQVIIFGGLFPR